MAWYDRLFGRRGLTTSQVLAAETAPPRPVAPGPVRPIPDREHGVAGTEIFGGYIRGEDFNPELDDFVAASKLYDKMRKIDAQVKATLQVIKLPLRSATWRAVPPEGGDPVDQKIADFVNAALFDDDAMQEPWDFVLRHILLQMDFGFSVLEKIWTVQDDGTYRLKRLAPRLPKTIREWHTDRNGNLLAIVQYAPVPSSDVRRPVGSVVATTPTYHTTVSYQYLTIPAEYAAVFSLEREGDNFQGQAVLRTIYRNWYYKDLAYHTEAVRLDRWGVGIPIAELEVGHGLTDTDQANLKKVLQAIRANEKAFLVAPPGVRYRIIPDGSHAGSPGAVQWIDHHDSAMSRNILAGFLTMGRDPRGTLGFGSRMTDLFISSLTGVANGIAGDLKKQIVAPLCDLNFLMQRRQYPSVIVADLEQADLQNLIEILAKLSGTVITPQDDDETILRKILKLPPLRRENSRKVKTEKAEAAAKQAASAEAAAAEAEAEAEAAGRERTAPPEGEDRVELIALRERVAAVEARESVHVEVHPPNVEVHPPTVQMEAPHVETHLTMPRQGKVKKIIEHDLDPNSPTWGQIKSVTTEPIDDDDKSKE